MRDATRLNRIESEAEMPQQFHIPKLSNTMADSLAVIGICEGFEAWLSQLRRRHDPIICTDCGSSYEITLPDPIELTDIESVEIPFTLGQAKILGSGKQCKKLKDAGHDLAAIGLFDYDRQIEIRNAIIEKRKELRKGGKKLSAEEEYEILGTPPDSDLSLYNCLNHFKVADTYNALLLRWLGSDLSSFHANLAAFLRLCGSTAYNTRASVDDEVTLLQVINPTSGKGGNASKANGLSVGNLSGFWLTEYLKFVGYFTIAAPVPIKKSTASGSIKKNKDRKTFVVRPSQVDLFSLKTIMREFRSHFYSNSAIKVDILAALLFTDAFVKQCHSALQARADTEQRERRIQRHPRVNDISQGFDVAFYKDMGSAFATMNTATINLPDWLRDIETVADATVNEALLAEHMAVIRGIQNAKQEETSEEIALLQRYRDFLSGRDTVRFFEFAAHFGDYHLAHQRRNLQVGQFTTEGMKKLVSGAKASDLVAILEDEGFEAIATSIRQATVIAQSQATRTIGTYPYEVRYGLGQQLLRAAPYPATFMGELAEFLLAYSSENARVDERITKGSLSRTRKIKVKDKVVELVNWRPPVETEHLKKLALLVEKSGSEVVCKLLVAYGYARDPKVQTDEPSQSNQDSDDESQDLDDETTEE